MSGQLKIKQTDGPPIIVGKRVTIGAIIGGFIATGVWLFEYTYGVPIPAPVAVGLTASLTGLVQVYIVNRYGVTQ